MQPDAILLGAIFVGVGVLAGVKRARIASMLHSYYNSIPDPKWRPRWLPWQFRPTERQALILARLWAWLFTVAGLALIVVGLV